MIWPFRQQAQVTSFHYIGIGLVKANTRERPVKSTSRVFKIQMIPFLNLQNGNPTQDYRRRRSSARAPMPRSPSEVGSGVLCSVSVTLFH